MNSLTNIDCYCAALEKKLDGIENKDRLTAEVKAYLDEETEFYCKERFSPKKAEILAIEHLGPVPRLAKKLRKLNSSRTANTVAEHSLFGQYMTELCAWYTERSMNMHHYSNIRWRELSYPALILFYNMALWVFLNLTDLIYPFPPGLLRILSSVCFIGITLFALWTHCNDKYAPPFCRFNLICFALSVIAVVFFYGILEAFLFDYGLYIIDEIYMKLYDEVPMYISAKIIALSACAVTAYKLHREGESQIFTLLIAGTLLIPLPAMLMKIPLVLIWFVVVLVYITAASVYITLYCKNKYLVRIVMQWFGVFALADTILFIAACLS